MYIERHIQKALRERARFKGAVVVTGARQVGKSTLMETGFPDFPRITFDDKTVLATAVDEPATVNTPLASADAISELYFMGNFNRYN
ncbi:MAG: hypothetical protein LBR77_07925 [Lachnospiraceae bacterium]|nr:hypothetical protein [Lachnospiraceae bacterium]